MNCMHINSQYQNLLTLIFFSIWLIKSSVQADLVLQNQPSMVQKRKHTKLQMQEEVLGWPTTGRKARRRAQWGVKLKYLM